MAKPTSGSRYFIALSALHVSSMPDFYTGALRPIVFHPSTCGSVMCSGGWCMAIKARPSVRLGLRQDDARPTAATTLNRFEKRVCSGHGVVLRAGLGVEQTIMACISIEGHRQARLQDNHPIETVLIESPIPKAKREVTGRKQRESGPSLSFILTYP
jgi:hypothetical protein